MSVGPADRSIDLDRFDAAAPAAEADAAPPPAAPSPAPAPAPPPGSVPAPPPAPAPAASSLAAIPPRDAAAPTGTEFLRSSAGLSRPAREEAIFDEIAAGNVPDFERQLKEVSVS